MAVPMYVVDAFASRPFQGNPAGVCLLDEPQPEDWMQSVAAEMKHAETAFVSPRDGGGFNLRWFTPSTEVDLCGHATLAAAHVLWEVGMLSEDEEAAFHTKSGTLTCTRHGYGIQMDFPSEPAKKESPTNHTSLLSALGLTSVVWIGTNRMDYLVQVENEQMLRRLDPDMVALTKFKVRGVIVTAKADSSDIDFVSRFFAPAAGVPEDPVTGSAHCCLAPFWAERLDKLDMIGHQCSARGGTVRVALRSDRVLLQGHAITTLVGGFLA